MASIIQFPKEKQAPTAGTGKVIPLGRGELVSLDFKRTLAAFKKYIKDVEKEFNCKLKLEGFNHFIDKKPSLYELQLAIKQFQRDMAVCFSRIGLDKE